MPVVKREPNPSDDDLSGVPCAVKEEPGTSSSSSGLLVDSKSALKKEETPSPASSSSPGSSSYSDYDDDDPDPAPYVWSGCYGCVVVIPRPRTPTFTQTDAMKEFGLTVKDLEGVRHTTQPNKHNSHSPMKIFKGPELSRIKNEKLKRRKAKEAEKARKEEERERRREERKNEGKNKPAPKRGSRRLRSQADAESGNNEGQAGGESGEGIVNGEQQAQGQVGGQPGNNIQQQQPRQSDPVELRCQICRRLCSSKAGLTKHKAACERRMMAADQEEDYF